MQKYRIVFLLLLLLNIRSTAHASPQPQTAPCYAAASAALSKVGSLYSQGGALAGDPLDPWGDYYPRTGPNSFDCSGLVWWAYAEAGVSVGSSTFSQVNDGVLLNCRLSDLAGAATSCWALGDLIFLQYPEGQHVAIYVGNGLFMDCYNHATGCILHDVASDSFYRSYFWQARRIVDGCSDQTLQPGSPSSPVGGGPDIEAPLWNDIPDLVQPVSFVIAQCSECDGQAAAGLSHRPAPETSWYDLGSVISWLAWSIEDTIVDLLCWLLHITQIMVNVASYIANTFILGVNSLWRLLIFVWLTLRGWFYAGWGWLELLREQLASLLGSVTYIAAFISLLMYLLLVAVEAVGQIASLILAIVSAIVGILGWIGAIASQMVAAIILAISATEVPAQAGDYEGHVVYYMLRGFLDALHSSSYTGWLFYLYYSMAWVSFVIWLARFLPDSKAED